MLLLLTLATSTLVTILIINAMFGNRSITLLCDAPITLPSLPRRVSMEVGPRDETPGIQGAGFTMAALKSNHIQAT
jgi:hypothetical protein